MKKLNFTDLFHLKWTC